MISRLGAQLFADAPSESILAFGIDAIDQTAAVGAGNKIALRIEGKNANVRFVALEENRMLAVGSYAEDFAVVSGGDIKIAGVVESKRPDVFGLGIEKDGGLPRFSTRGVWFEPVNLAVGIGGGIENSVLGHHQRLYLKLLRLKYRDRLSSRGDAINASGRSGGGEYFVSRAGGHSPDRARRCAGSELESGGEFERAAARDRDTMWGPFEEVFVFGLLPGAGTFGEGGDCGQKKKGE